MAGGRTADDDAVRLTLALSRRVGAEIACCGTCLGRRGLAEDRLVPEARRPTMDELAAWTVAADQALTV